MSPAPPPGPSSDSPRPVSRGGTVLRIAVLVVATALHALFTTTALIVTLIALWAFLLTGSDQAVYLAPLFVSAVVFTGTHWALVVLLRHVIGLAHPRTIAALVAVSVVTTYAQTLLLVGDVWGPAGISVLLVPFVVALVAFLVRTRTVVWTCAAVCGLALLYMLGFQAVEALTCTPSAPGTAEVMRGTAPPDACDRNPGTP